MQHPHYGAGAELYKQAQRLSRALEELNGQNDMDSITSELAISMQPASDRGNRATSP